MNNRTTTWKSLLWGVFPNRPSALGGSIPEREKYSERLFELQA